MKVKLLVLVLVFICATAYAEEIDIMKLLSMKSGQSTSVDQKKALLSLFTEKEQLELLAIDEYFQRYPSLTKALGFLNTETKSNFTDLVVHYRFFHSNFKDGVFKHKIPAMDSYGKIEVEIKIEEKTLKGFLLYLKERLGTIVLNAPIDEMNDAIFKIEDTHEIYKEIFNKEKARLEREQEYKSLKLKYDYDRAKEKITPADVFLK